jgi:serine/threonine protein kinase
MAPEVLYNRVVTLKADIFSLGVVIMEILTGQKEYYCVVENVRTTKIRDYTR